MKRSKAIISLIITVLLLGALGYASVLGIGESKSGSAQSIPLGLDLAGGVSITYEVSGDENPSASDMADTIYKLQQRVDNYSTEAQVYQEGLKRINIEIPGVTDANTILEELGQPGNLYFIAQTDDSGNENYSFVTDESLGFGYYMLNKSIDTLLADGGIVLQGEDVANAQAGYQNSGTANNQEPVVELEFTPDGTVKFAEATKKAYAAGESIAIYYDGSFISVPNVQAEITDGRAVITGESSYEAADRLASLIRIGGLKLQLTELRSNVVGAQLGSDAIRTSLIAAAVGFVLILLFMIVMFKILGVAASIALTFYAGLMVFLLSAFEITLTLPGIAGIILSIGMAVDANVIIFARIREEIAKDVSVATAMKTGYSKALSAIIDGNVTTLIAAAILGIRGTGTVQGFAVTLALGIVVSMFTALVITRLIMNGFYGVGLNKEKYYGRAKQRKMLDIVKRKWVFVTISAILVLSAPVLMAVNKSAIGHPLNFSLEFLGGTSTTADMGEDMTLDRLESEVKPLVAEITGDNAINISNVEGSKVNIRTRELSLDEREALTTVLEDKYGLTTDDIEMENISATISNEMQADAIWATVIALICMLVYIWIRFRDVRFGAASVIALFHYALGIFCSVIFGILGKIALCPCFLKLLSYLSTLNVFKF